MKNTVMNNVDVLASMHPCEFEEWRARGEGERHELTSAVLSLLPNMDVCEQFRNSIIKPQGYTGYEFNVPRPGKVRCIEAKTDKPVNP
ncbi:conjugation system SOS inhibitor PsiB family protein [Pantoea ananatis]|uniref:conjugation system SOS inhibitor PsiB family protein n=1 Tax=Pantoea ananas TaxID=553 RepID=UPI00164295F9|nr:conjugation system SOS inhibitor PsiB family protein [Pantoea ananatis]